MKRIVASVGIIAVAAFSAAQGIGPGTDPYLQFSDSPWASTSFQYFHLEDFENGGNVPGVSASAGNILGPSGITDSVDGDDGNLDGFGTAGHSFFAAGGSTGISFSFEPVALGGLLPTHAGIVWTDGAGTITFEAFDQNGISLGTLSGTHAGAGFGGQTDEDRFYGWVNNGGISRIHIRNSSGGIEVDHLQYGAVPEPTTLTLLGLGALAALRRKKSK